MMRSRLQLHGLLALVVGLVASSVVRPPPARAQVGAWTLEGVVKLQGFERGKIETQGWLVLLPDGTYRALNTVICGSSGSIDCERGRWARDQKGRISLVDVQAPEGLVVSCLFPNAWVRSANARLKGYRTTITDKGGMLAIRSVATGRARFIFGWKQVRGVARITGTPADSESTASLVEYCDEGY